MANRPVPGKKKSFLKVFTSKHPKVLPRTFIGLFLAGLLAGIIAFAVLLGMDPSSSLNQKSLIGFLDFSLILAICCILWYGFGPQRKGKLPAATTSDPGISAAVK